MMLKGLTAWCLVRQVFDAKAGDVVLMTDVDLSAPLTDLGALASALRAGADLALGSRALPGSRIVVHQHPAREGLGKAFNVALEDGSDDDVVVRVEGRRATGDRLMRVITKALTTTGGDVSGVIACISDVTEATLIGRELERRATYDALTACLNRAAILSRLESALAPGPGAGAAAVFIDLDEFKSINDTFGHAVGDEVLATAARVLDGTTRSTDVVGRIGGDEFLVVCQDVRDPEMALQLATRIGAELHATRVDRAGVALRGSVGVAWAERGSTDAEQLVRRADEAMYASKREGEGTPHLAV